MISVYIYIKCFLGWKHMLRESWHLLGRIPQVDRTFGFASGDTGALASSTNKNHKGMTWGILLENLGEMTWRMTYWTRSMLCREVWRNSPWIMLWINCYVCLLTAVRPLLVSFASDISFPHSMDCFKGHLKSTSVIYISLPSNMRVLLEFPLNPIH